MGKDLAEKWKVNIFNSIKDISDIEFQKLAWMGRHPTKVSSFTEIINVLYDDNDFEEFIQYTRADWGQEKLHELLLEINRIINAYNATDKMDVQILEDPEWHSITEVANKIIFHWITR